MFLHPHEQQDTHNTGTDFECWSRDIVPIECDFITKPEESGDGNISDDAEHKIECVFHSGG